MTAAANATLYSALCALAAGLALALAGAVIAAACNPSRGVR